MMYTGFPRVTRFAVKSGLAVAWACAAGAGASVVVFPSDDVALTLGWWRLVAGSVVVLAGIVAAIGAATERYRWEWVAAWFVAAGIVPYAVIAWLVASQTGHPAGAWYTTAGVVLMISRALFCSGFAARLRADHLAVIEHVQRSLLDTPDDADNRGD